MPVIEEKKGTSKFFMLIVLGILGYASWYFFTQFDKKHLSELIPFIDEQTIEKFVGSSDEVTEVFIKETTSEKVVAELEVVQNEVASPAITEAEETSSVQEEVVTETAEAVESETETGQEEVAIEKRDILILPFSRLWFGLINMQTKDRDHFSIDSPYKLDVTENIWLVATSSAPFSLVDGDESKDFSDAKEHYFKIDKNGIAPLTKSEYVTLGGWSQW
jgi:cytoskeletal protein RodZ